MPRGIKMVGLIVAKDRQIMLLEKNGQIPWKIKGEQRQFKELKQQEISL